MYKYYIEIQQLFTTFVMLPMPKILFQLYDYIQEETKY